MLRTSTYQEIIRFDAARTIAGRGVYWTTCYRVDGTLIDTGCAHSAHEMVEALAGKPLERIINTHSHEDHIGANGRLQRERPGLEILAHPLAIPVLADPRHEQPLHPYRRIFWGWPEPSLAKPVAEGCCIDCGDLQFQLLYTPGHSRDHYCLYEAERQWLFSGDLYVGGQDRALREGYDIWQIIASLKRVGALPCRVLFPGSARVRENPKKELEEKIAYLEELGGKVLDRHAKGWSVDAIVKDLCGKPTAVEWVTLGNFSRRHLVRSYLQGKSK
jgi:glyoxylase-like metal-dependent hydrolase (beta-lactamase superfamily II)